MTDSNYLSRNQNSPASKTSEGSKSYFRAALSLPDGGIKKRGQETQRL
jgi:hypothetical protein